MAQITIHGFRVEYEESCREAINYLSRDIDYREAKVFFDQARSKGNAQFETDSEKNYTLSYHNGLYSIASRGGAKAFF